jgi:hypothetical protein
MLYLHFLTGVFLHFIFGADIQRVKKWRMTAIKGKLKGKHTEISIKKL